MKEKIFENLHIKNNCETFHTPGGPIAKLDVPKMDFWKSLYFATSGKNVKVKWD